MIILVTVLRICRDPKNPCLVETVKFNGLRSFQPGPFAECWIDVIDVAKLLTLLAGWNTRPGNDEWDPHLVLVDVLVCVIDFVLVGVRVLL